MNLSKLKIAIFTLCSVSALLAGYLNPLTVHAATFNPNYIIPDSAFDFSSNSWTPSQIDSWLNSNYPSGCISGSFRTPDPKGWNSTTNQYDFGANVTAGQAIYDAAKNYYLDPKIILTMLQKEQSIVTGAAGCYPTTPNPNWPAASPDQPTSGKTFTCTINGKSVTCTYACTYSGGCMPIAMSYNCPGYCEAKTEGFSNQLIFGAWVLKFAEQRAYGRTTGYPGYDPGDEVYAYSGPLVPPAGDGSYHTLDGYNLTITNGATASLYTYNPFYSGNKNFFNIYTGWFGNPNTACYGTSNLSGIPTGRQLFASHFNSAKPDYITLTEFNNTGSTCSEVHGLSYGSTAWRLHNQTVIKAIDPSTAEFLTGNLNGNSTGSEQLLYMVYNGPGGVVNFRVLSSDFRSYVGGGHATPIPALDPSKAEIIAGDINGDGRDELIYVVYNGPGNVVNVRILNSSYNGYAGGGYATPIPALDPSKAEIIAGDLNGDGKDELIYVVYNGPGNVVNVRVLTPDFRRYAGGGYATPIPALDPSKAEIIAGDLNGDGKDELNYLVFCGPGNVVNLRTLSANFQKYAGGGVATPIGCYNPST